MRLRGSVDDGGLPIKYYFLTFGFLRTTSFEPVSVLFFNTTEWALKQNQLKESSIIIIKGINNKKLWLITLPYFICYRF